MTYNRRAARTPRIHPMTLTRRDVLVTAAVPVAALACGAMYGAVAPSSRNVGLVAGRQAIDTREFDRRHAAVRTAMDAHGVDCLLVPINENLTYLTNVATIAYGAYLLFPIEGPPTLMINPISYWSARTGRLTHTAYAGGELAQTIRDSSVVADIEGVSAPDFVFRIRAWCERRGLERKTLGVVGREYDFPRGGGTLVGVTGPAAIGSQFLKALFDALPQMRMVDATPLLAGVRAFKSPSEIESLRRATDLADRCRQALTYQLSLPGATDSDLFAAYFQTLLAYGGAGSWWFMLSVNPSSAPQMQNWRDSPQGRRIEPGDIVMAEIMPAWRDGYVGHAESCMALETIAQAASYHKVESVALQSHYEVVSELRPGTSLNKVLAAADGPIAAAGLMRGAPIAYGLGLFGLEPPMLGLNEAVPPETTLHAGMVLCVICHVFDKETRVTVRTGSTQLITERGSECLNTRSVPGGLVRVSRS
jgi:Xaa-Pro aminopeptidase